MPTLYPEETDEDVKYSCYKKNTRRSLIKTGYISDNVHFLMGARLRQVRMPMQTCNVPIYIREYFPTCIDNYQINKEESNNYLAGWIPLDSENFSKPDSGFEYFSGTKTKTSPYYHTFALYNGGGYVAQLGPDKDSAFNIVTFLYNSKWVDRQTKAIFIEMLILNPQTKYFTTITMALEFLETGGSIQIKLDIYSFFLNYFADSQGGLRFILCLISLIFIIIFAVKEGIQIYYLRKKYFQVINLKNLNVFLAIHV